MKPWSSGKMRGYNNYQAHCRCAITTLRYYLTQESSQICIPCAFSERFKICLYLNYVNFYFFPFICILIISCCIFFTRTVLDGRVHCNSQNIIHLYALLVKITAFGFISCSRVDSILCTPTLVQRVGSFLRVFSTNYFIFSIYNLQNCPTLISKFNWWFSTLF